MIETWSGDEKLSHMLLQEHAQFELPIIHSNRQVREYKMWRAWGTPHCCLHTNSPPQPPAHTHIAHIYSCGLRQDKEIDTLELLFSAGQSQHREPQSNVFVTILFWVSGGTHHYSLQRLFIHDTNNPTSSTINKNNTWTSETLKSPAPVLLKEVDGLVFDHLISPFSCNYAKSTSNNSVFSFFLQINWLGIWIIKLLF